MDVDSSVEGFSNQPITSPDNATSESQLDDRNGDDSAPTYSNMEHAYSSASKTAAGKFQTLKILS